MLDDVPSLGEGSRPNQARAPQSSNTISETTSAQELLAIKNVDVADGIHRQPLSFISQEDVSEYKLDAPHG